ncbi:MAG: hypothetical protein M1275_02555 [Patescibacteria group bacterium]|nr:hypothetical protein [Patescibacteria group bacterium]
MTLEEYKQKLITDRDLRNRVQRCPLCNSSIADRKVTIFEELIGTLYRVYCWCGEKERHEFDTKDVRHLMGKNEYARFGDLVRFGGLVYKPKDDDGKTRKGWFGINMARAKEFFSGQRQIPVEITLNQITNEIIDSKYVSIGQFPELSHMIDHDGQYGRSNVVPNYLAA